MKSQLYKNRYGDEFTFTPTEDGNIKHAPDSMSNDEYKAYERCREELRELMFENGVKFD
jgi:hypothetical protein